jgi:hypothetical protein
LTYFGGQGTKADQGIEETGAETTHKKLIGLKKPIVASNAIRDQQKTPASAKSDKK